MTAQVAISECVEPGAVRVEKPFPDYALPRVWSWIQQFRQRVTDDFSPQTLEEFVAQWEESKARQTTWGVWRGAELGGLVAWEPWPVPGVGVSHALFKPEFWGRGTTRTALDLVYGELFAGGVRKIINLPFGSNHAIIGLGKSIGARTEGVLRKQTLQGGKPVDLVVLGLLKEDFERWRSTGAVYSKRAAAPSVARLPIAAAPALVAQPSHLNSDLSKAA